MYVLELYNSGVFTALNTMKIVISIALICHKDSVSFLLYTYIILTTRVISK